MLDIKLGKWCNNRFKKELDLTLLSLSAEVENENG